MANSAIEGVPSTPDSFLGQPRPLGRVVLFSVLTGLLYYGYYKWVIQDELKRYTGSDWSGAIALLPFILGVAVPPALATWDPDVPSWFAWFFLLGILWIYIVQFRLYCTVNRLYREAGMAEPLTVWWMFVPGLNLLVGLRQIHFLSEYWAMKRQEAVIAPLSCTEATCTREQSLDQASDIPGVQPYRLGS